jgi:hypothetical protein
MCNDKINAPSAPLFNMTSIWPFVIWGIDVIGPISPKANNRHCFILVAIINVDTRCRLTAPLFYLTKRLFGENEDFIW